MEQLGGATEIQMKLRSMLATAIGLVPHLAPNVYGVDYQGI